MIEHLTEQLEQLNEAQQKYAGEKETYREKNAELRHELARLESENFVLEQKIKREQEKQQQNLTEVAKEEFDLEIEEERHFNALSKSPSSGTGRRRSLGHPGADRARSGSLPMSQLGQENSLQFDMDGRPHLSPRLSPRQSPRAIPVPHAHSLSHPTHHAPHHAPHHNHHHVNSLPTYPTSDVNNNPLLSTSPTKISPQASRKDRSLSLIKAMQSPREPRERSNSNTSTGSTSASDTEEK